MKRTWLNRLGYVVGIIIMGAISIGVWNKLLSPLWDMLTDGIIKLFSLASASFTNMIYAKVAMGFHEETSVTLLIIFIIIFCIANGISVPVMDLFRRLDKADTIIDSFRTFYRLNYYFFITLHFTVLFLIIVLVFISIKTAYVNRVISNSLNSIEIVSPHIGIQQTLELRSMFHSIQTSDDYEDFYKTLKALEKAFKVKLPLSTPL